MALRCVALGPKDAHIATWANDDISWSSELPSSLHNLLNGRYNNSGQSNSPVACIDLGNNGRYGVVFKDGRWKTNDSALADALELTEEKVRCLTLGDDDSYIVIEDNGRVSWRTIPHRAKELIMTRSNSSLKWAALGADEAYFLLFEDGKYFWNPNELQPGLRSLLQQGQQVKRVYLSAFCDNYVLVTDEKTYWQVSDTFSNEMGLVLRPSEIRFSHDSIAAVFADGRSIKDTFLAITRKQSSVKDIPRISVVRDYDGYVSLNNRRLAVFRLLELYWHRELQVPVQVVPRPDDFYGRYTTDCAGECVDIRNTDYYIGRTREETNFNPFHDRLSKVSGRSGDSDDNRFSSRYSSSSSS
mmetsp:Transcript_35342/g.82588  ORF Transcript_35342/g.82588 Transcript_35342/m.82588 type:complete len:357 (-) Transcript_35342:117-1187(-)|eukprot:CAMPEP_0178412848 /NCGR_PEP_ID=MMETSP0689_2-20121128/22225_1 /TAXON_ID=160604 /ORGANISM="Amphidinium massartii, Strain CS-259" /LENGTH=356 /DNA_ID=CAMNT_0020034105 /DNA_START=40 /DNA_END=1110 /DNA_ORIENTATION=-